jgi:hypothetical protein
MMNEAYEKECCYGDSNPSRERESRCLPNRAQIVRFLKSDLDNYVKIRTRGINPNTSRQIRRVSELIWEQCGGTFSQQTLTALGDYYLTKYPSESQREKCYNYTRAFMKHLFKMTMDNTLLMFLAIFEKPKYRRERKLLTSRIIVQEDIAITLTSIQADKWLPVMDKLNYQGMILFLAYSGQRPLTGAKTTAGQFREALAKDPHVLTIEAAQDKIRLEHYVPLHPNLISYVRLLIQKRQDEERVFDYLGLQRWLRYHPVALTHTKGKLELKDLRKFFEQKSDEIGFTDANKNFIMSHGVSSINWSSYKQFLPENVYKRYMECWGSLEIFKEESIW